MKRPQAGFTLLELMVVLAIAGILMAVGIPAMRDFIRNGRITSAANDVMAALHFARSEAIKRRLDVTLCTSANALEADGDPNPSPDCAATSNLAGWIVFVDNAPFGTREAGDEVLLNRGPMNPEIVGRSSVNPLAVTYQANGFARNTNAGRLVLCDERGNVPSSGDLSAARGILVSVTGRAGVTRDRAQIQGLINAINATFAGCTPG